MPHYEPLNTAALAEIMAIVGDKYVLVGPDIPEEYTRDAWTPPGPPRYPEAVVFPANTEEVAAIVRSANRRLFPVVPRGGGTGLSGGTVPVYGGVIVDLSRMNQIIKIDPKARYIVAEPAVLTLDIQKEAAKHGLLYAGDPSSDDCVIGGNVATNAGGNRAVKYGVTADQIYELEIVTPQGEIVNLGGRLKKNSTGYGLVKLIIGSEGTLGIVTRITLKLNRLAPIFTTSLALFPNFSDAAAAVTVILDDPLLDPISLEIIDQKTMAALARYREDWRFSEQGGDCLIIQLEAKDEGEQAEKQNQLAAIIQKAGGIHLHPDSEKVWQARREFGKAIQAESSVLGIEDVVVPVDELPDFSAQLYKIAQTVGLEVRIAGHAGDGNVHIQILPGDTPEPEWESKFHHFTQILHSDVYSRGGRISGEHGIGVKRKQYFLEHVNPVELELMKSVKKSFDPQGILNPGKIFDIAGI
ncbi:putative FAD-linked oxidoreductase [Sporomusa silvacetica DSM 10669]|uniref:FAD-linked oxidoreductase n=1 Tax=Sporomusa silvacetica DSM 10669 TaxID=1123289 RepID=A0ABZ3IHW1_9FIRM|nr:FAD-binding oxidoreductase [Sporomusa silvacetica]OZC14840.1 putative FAD-linked oxidoreductase [Sporomusa silvacetica DSM 10669]